MSIVKKRIWLISEYYYPIVTSTGYYITEIAEYLAQKGQDVHVICTNSRYNESEDFKFMEYEEHNGVVIHRVITKEINKDILAKRIIRLLCLSTLMSLKILRNIRRNESVLMVTNPAFLILMMPILSKIKKFKYKVLIHDIFPENLVAIGKTTFKKSKKYQFLTKIFNWSYSKSELCITVGRDMNTIVKDKIKSNNLVVIPNWADISEVFPIPKKNTNFYYKHNLSGFTFMFAGNLGHAQGLDNILSALRLINNNEIKFIFVGGGAKEEVIKAFCKENKNTFHVGFQDRSTQNDFLNACDVGVVTLSDGMFGLGVPSKSYNIMASGHPILFIGHEESEIALTISENKIGWVVEPNNPAKLAKTIEMIYESRNCLHDMQQLARTTAEKFYSKELILSTFHELLTSHKHA